MTDPIDTKPAEGAAEEIAAATETVANDAAGGDHETAPGTADDPLASLAAALGELGLAPEGNFVITDVAEAALRSQALTIAEMRAKLASAEKASERDRAKVKALEAEKPAKPRKAGRPKEEAAFFDADDLLSMIASADDVQLLFSDGAKEIPGLLPVRIEGDAWVKRGNSVLLSGLAELIIHGAAIGGQEYSIAGYALFVDGKQAAWSERFEPLTVAPGARVSIKDDVIFRG